MLESVRLGMGFRPAPGVQPALGSEVHSDAGSEEAEGDGERADDPGELDASLEHEVVEDAEDEDEDGGLSEEGRAAPAGDESQVKPAAGGRFAGLSDGLYVREVDACGELDWGGAIEVKHKRPLYCLLSA